MSQRDERARLGAPVTLNDLLSVLLISRGVNPSEAIKTAPARPKRKRDGVTRGKRASVNVHGGQASEAALAIADQWHSVNMPKDMARRTNSTPEGIAWLFSGD